MKLITIILVTLWLAALAGRVCAHDEGRAEYLGNAGILVEFGDAKVLIDAFYANSYGQYALVREETTAAMLEGDPPYDGIDAVIVSHVHGDHFSAAPTIAYLRAQPSVKLFGSAQVTAAVEAAGLEGEFEGRLVTVRNRPEDPPTRLTHDEIEIDAVALPHAGGPSRADIDNLAFRVTLAGGPTVVHFGDAAAERAAFARHAEHWRAKRHEGAFPPYWLLLDETGRALLDEFIDAKQTIGVHVPQRAAGEGDAWREQAGADLFTDRGEERRLR